jgi:cytochrome c553
MRWSLILMPLLLLAAIPRSLIADEAAALNFFQQQIEPLLVARCLTCHGSEGKAGLDLRSRETVAVGGDSGAVIEPGNPAASVLFQLVSAGEMPPEQPLGQPQIAAIEKWIADGGYFPTQPLDPFAITTDTRAGYDWWSLRPLQNPTLPNVPADAPGAWGNHAIDRFVFAKLAAAGLQPSPATDPVTLIRRATFDLTGLPATPTRARQFVDDCYQETGFPNRIGPKTYTQLIDELLQSPHYGEQWGRHWLDVVRFGESNGFERNVIHETVWPFRDYVIRSLNDDKSFRQLIIEHLAADSIDADDPQVAVGTAFLVCGPYDNVGNQDKDAAAQIRADAIDEMIRATSEAFLGLTVGCSRCHDHKFDPISQRDYYAMYATFAGVRHGNRTLRPQQPATERNQAAALSSLRAAVNAQLNTDQFEPVVARYVRFTISATTGAEPCLDELEVFTPTRDGAPSQNVAAANAGAIASSSGDFPNHPFHKLEHINDGRYGNARSWISNQTGGGWVQIELPETLTIDRVVWGRDRDEQYHDRVPVGYKIEVAVEPGQWREVASSKDRPPFQPDAVDEANTYRWWVGNFRQEDGPFHVFIGGSPQRLGEIVTPQSLSSLERTVGGYQLDTAAPEVERRRRLADWIVDQRNPLTPRVLANRLWHYHFGTGIVSTPSDFGFLGGQPSHPELLDWLAVELQRHDWRLKPMHRQIMLSQTYQQSGDYRADAFVVDGESRLLWRFPPRRLSGEEIRDTTLAVSGKLDLQMGGLGFRLFKYVQDNVATYHPLDEHSPETYRRAVYHHNARAMQIDLMSEFDKPDCAFSTPRRSTTTTPLQALTMMNHRFVIDMAAALAERIAQESNDPDEQITRAFQLAFLRNPDEQELAATRALIDDHGTAAFCRALFNSNEFIYVR